MTTASLQLNLLKCLRCGRPLSAQEDEVAWSCAQCGQGLQLTPSGLAPLNLAWATGRPGNSQLQWLPFWVFVGAVTFSSRESYEGRRPPDSLWNAPVWFYVPAFAATLPQMQDLGANLTRRQVRLTAGPAQSTVTGCTLTLDEAYQAADFIVLTIEAAQSDKLKLAVFSVKPDQPALWMLPFAGQALAQNLALPG